MCTNRVLLLVVSPWIITHKWEMTNYCGCQAIAFEVILMVGYLSVIRTYNKQEGVTITEAST